MRAFNFVVEKGWVSDFQMAFVVTRLTRIQALYWATSEWSAQEIEEAHRACLPKLHYQILTMGPDVATKLNLIPPIAEQCKHKYVFHSGWNCTTLS